MSISYRLGQFIGQYKKGIEDVFSTSGSHAGMASPNAFSHPTMWGEALGRGRRPKTKGEYVSHFQNWVYIGVKLNAQAVASNPLRLYVAKPEGKQVRNFPTKAVEKESLKNLQSRAWLSPYFKKEIEVEELEEHPFLDLMNHVNPIHNSRDLKEFTTMFSDLTGESYWLIINDTLGIPREVWPIPSQYINPKFGDTLANPIEYYVYKRGQKEVEIPVEQVIHFTYPNPHNIFTGFSCVQGIASAVYIRSEMDAFEEALFENRTKFGGVFSPKENVTEDNLNRVKKSIGQQYKGSRKAGKNLYLPIAFDYHKDAMTPEELNFLEGQKWNMAETLAAFDIPESIYLKDANKANSEAADYRHAKYGIKPRCDRFEQKVNEKLIPSYGNEGVKIFCAFDNPVPEDKDFAVKQQESDLRSGATINEIRARRGEEPIEGGDEPMVDSRLKPLSQAMNPPAPPTFEEQVDEVKREIWDILN